MIRILLVEDQYFARIALHTVVDGHEGMQIVAETPSGEDAVRLYAEHRPDLCIVDLRLPGMSGLEVMAQIRHQDADAAFVVLSNYSGSEDVHRALRAGASAYLTKDAGADELIAAIRAVHQGRQYLPEALSHLLEHRHPDDELTARELDVLTALASGMSNRDIADRLGIAEKTVRLHLTHVFQKLGVADRTQAVLEANRRGLVHLG